MNLLEHYIIEVQEVVELTTTPPLIKVKVLCDCWGNRSVAHRYTTKEEWEQDLKRGYFMA